MFGKVNQCEYIKRKFYLNDRMAEIVSTLLLSRGYIVDLKTSELTKEIIVLNGDNGSQVQLENGNFLDFKEVNYYENSGILSASYKINRFTFEFEANYTFELNFNNQTLKYSAYQNNDTLEFYNAESTSNLELLEDNPEMLDLITPDLVMDTKNYNPSTPEASIPLGITYFILNAKENAENLRKKEKGKTKKIVNQL